MTLANPVAALVATDATLDSMLAAPLPTLLLLWNGDSLRSDLRVEFDKIVSEYGHRLQIAKINTHDNPQAAQRFDVENQPVLVGWHGGTQLVRRSRPWGTDARGLAEQLSALLPPDVTSASEKAIASKPVVVTDATFNDVVIGSDIPAVVDFWAAWCGPCKTIAPIVERLAAEFAGKVLFAKVNVDENPGLSQAFQVKSIPTLMFVKNRKIVAQNAGVIPEVPFRETINKLLALAV